MSALINVLVLAVAVVIVTRLVPGIRCKDFKTALVVAAGVSVLNFIVFKVLFFLALPFMALTLFLGYFVLNAGILWVVDEFVEDFEVKGVGNLVLGSVLISAIGSVLNWLLRVIF